VLFQRVSPSPAISETIRHITCWSQQHLGIAEDEWVLLVKTLGSIKDIHTLALYCDPGSRNFRPFQAVADTVNNAQSLCKIRIGLHSETLPRDALGLTALATALRENTGLQEFRLINWCPLLEATQSTTFGPMILEVSACPLLKAVCIYTKFPSADLIRNLLRLPTNITLSLAMPPKHWLPGWTRSAMVGAVSKTSS
jgi:hypothetical protein